MLIDSKLTPKVIGKPVQQYFKKKIPYITGGATMVDAGFDVILGSDGHPWVIISDIKDVPSVLTFYEKISATIELGYMSNYIPVSIRWFRFTRTNRTSRKSANDCFTEYKENTIVAIDVDSETCQYILNKNTWPNELWNS